MKLLLSSRLWFRAAVILLLAAAPSFARAAGPKKPPPPVPQSRPATRAESREFEKTPPHSFAPRRPMVTMGPATGVPRQPHIEQWIESHKALSPAEQHRALQNEAGFRELDPTTQQRELSQLDRLNQMNPEQRSRVLNRVEGLERLSPQQQQQWDGAVQRLHSVAVPRRRLMMRAVIDLRQMPPEQRQQVIDSPAFGAQFSADERQDIRTILTAYPNGRTGEAP